MTNLTTALAIVLSINVILILAQTSILELNPDGAQFYNSEGSLIDDFDAGNNTLNDDDPSSVLPSAESSVSPETGNIFTDAFTGIKNWLLDTTGLSYLFTILGAPYHFLLAIGLPKTFSFLIGSAWYGLTLLLIIAFMFGRDA